MKKLSIVLVFLTAVMTLAGCDQDLQRTPQAVQKTFEAMFPQAVHVEWEKNLGQYKAEFYSDGHETEAWFDKNGNFQKAATELQVPELPEAVKATVDEYCGTQWTADDVDFIRMSSGIREFYRVELDKVYSEREKILNIKPDGTIITRF